MAQIAGLKDFRKQGPPADIGTFQFSATIIVFNFTFSGTTTTVAMAAGVSGWVLIAQSTVAATVIQAAVDTVEAQGGGRVFIRDGLYMITIEIRVESNNIEIWGESWNTILRRDASLDNGIIWFGSRTVQIRVDNCVLANIQLDGNKAAGGIVTAVDHKGVCFHSSPKADWTDPTLFGWNNTAYRVYVHDCGAEGVSYDYQIQPKCIDCLCEDNDWFDIAFYFSRMGVMSGCIATDGELGGFNCDGLQQSIVVNNLSRNHPFTGPGFRFNHTIAAFTVTDNIIANNYSFNDQSGIRIGADATGLGAERNIVANNTVEDSILSGMYCERCHRNQFLGNYVDRTQSHGFYLAGSTYNNIHNTYIYNVGFPADTEDGFYLLSIDAEHCTHNIIKDNVIIADDAWRTRYGINEEDANQDYNTIKDNYIEGMGTAPAKILGVNDILSTIPIPLVQGTTFISAAGEAWGWEIDEDTEFALGIGWLPLEVQQVVRIRITGVALADPGADNEIRAQFTGEAATFHEPFATHPIDVVDKDCEETDPDIGDVIHWVLTSADDADITSIVGGGRLQLKVLYEDAGGGSIATDAIVDTIQIEFV